MFNQVLQSRYQIIQLLSSGAFGQTYLAKDLNAPDTPACVIKQLKPQPNSTVPFEAAKTLFDREISTLRLLANHPQIPQILNEFEINQEFYLVQEYIEGRTLREEFDQEPVWDQSQAVLFLNELLKILAFIHDQGIIHRDIKPENIIRRARDQKLFLIDFGAVKYIPAFYEQSSSTIIHSRGYTPPEQLAGAPNPNSDIYALGMTCIEGVTNTRAESLTQLRDPNTQAIVWAEAIKVSDQLKRILSKMTDVHPRDRYSSATQVLQDLETFQQEKFLAIARHSYTPTEIVTSCNGGDNQSTNSRAYISTEWRSTHSAAGFLQEGADEDEAVVESGNVSEPLQNHLRHKENADKIFQNLQERLNHEATSQLRNVTVTIHQFPKKKLILISAVLATVGTGLSFFYYFTNRKFESTVQLFPSPGLTISANFANQKQLANFEEKSHFIEHTSAIKFLAFTPNGEALISAGEEGAIKLRDISNQTSRNLVQTKSKILAISSSAKGDILAIATEDKLIEIWELKKHRKIRQILGEQLTWSLALKPDGSALAAGGLGKIRLWKKVQLSTEGYEDRLFSAQEVEPVQSIAYSAADVLVAGSADGRVKIMNPNIRQTQTFSLHSKAIPAIAFEANHSVVLTGSEDTTIRLWNVHTLKEHTLPVIQTNVGGVRALASSPAGRMIAAGGAYGAVQIWDWHTGQPVANYSNHAAEVTALAFSPNGRMLAVGDREGKITIYGSK